MANEKSFEGIKEKKQKSEQFHLQTIFYVISALSSAGYIAYVISFWKIIELTVGADHGHKIAFIIVSAALALEALMEVPTGALADRFRHHRSVRWSFAVLALTSFIYFFVVQILLEFELKDLSLVLIICAEIFLALGTALLSGSFDSWFVSNMAKEGYEKKFLTPFFAKKRIVTNVTFLIVGSLALLLKAENHIEIAFLIGIACHLAGYFMSRKFVTGKNISSPIGPIGNFLFFLMSLMKEEFYGALREILKSTKLTITVISYAIFSALGIVILFFWEPLTNTKANVEEELTMNGIIIFLAFSFARIVGNKLAETIKMDEDGYRESRIYFLILGQFLTAFPLICLAVFRNELALWVVILFISLSRVGQELSKPIFSSWTYEEVRNKKLLASVGSLIEASAGCVMALVLVSILLGNIASDKSAMLSGIVSLLSCSVIIISIPLIWFVSKPHLLGRRT